MKLVLSLFILVFMTPAFSANLTLSELLESHRKAMQMGDYTDIGMDIVGVEDDQVLMASFNRRFLIKAQVRDLWDGIDSIYVRPQKVTALHHDFDPTPYSINFGNSSKPKIRVYMSYDCHSCQRYARYLTEEATMNLYNISVHLVYRNEEERNVVKDVMCSEDKAHAFKQVFANRNPAPQDSDCISNSKVNMNVKLANIQKIATLPATIIGNTAIYGSIDLTEYAN